MNDQFNVFKLEIENIINETDEVKNNKLKTLFLD